MLQPKHYEWVVLTDAEKEILLHRLQKYSEALKVEQDKSESEQDIKKMGFFRCEMRNAYSTLMIGLRPGREPITEKNDVYETKRIPRHHENPYRTEQKT